MNYRSWKDYINLVAREALQARCRIEALIDLLAEERGEAFRTQLDRRTEERLAEVRAAHQERQRQNAEEEGLRRLLEGFQGPEQ